MPTPIPLSRPDLSCDDARAVLEQLARAPFRDVEALRRWEGMWESVWQRRAVAFADHGEAWRLLGELLGWRAGDVLVVDALLDPVWREAVRGCWWHEAVRDVEPESGRAVGAPFGPVAGGMVRGEVIRHACGWPVDLPSGEDGTWVAEEISSVVRPWPGVGRGAVQLVDLSGSGLLPVGTGCVLLSTDGELVAALAHRRRHLPSAAACALGCALLTTLPGRLERRRQLAGRYRAWLRLAGWATMPRDPPSGREWALFCLAMRTEESRIALADFLRRADIGCGAPVWFHPVTDSRHDLSGLKRFLGHALALPLYAALSDAECKRIVNRIHRWVDRQPVPGFSGGKLIMK
ncbi:MAG: DegT/DnrJ/EryC1/StrS family aminotransferase [Magnetococcales bacterium]|nr:DegT/DnrJ/EryC1/StrS family aminotransferase [Magnetococcales bacterium]